MAEIVNLNKARKARAKDEASKAAARNRTAFGRTKADRELEAARQDKARRELEGAKLEEE